MSAKMILASAQLIGMVLSFALLHRTRRLSVGLCSTVSSRQSLPAGSDVTQSVEIEKRFRT
jgi:hypothetical protein